MRGVIAVQEATDAYLNIKTEDIIYFDSDSEAYDDYFESEPTDYKDLEQLRKYYQPICAHPYFIDYGCGTGRALYFIHHFYQLPVSGIEVNPDTFKLCEMNRRSYLAAHPSPQPLRLFHMPAEHYILTEEHNTFYFFNPFSLEIFTQVMNKIIQSYHDSPRLMELILYYPLEEYVDYLTYQTPFRRVKTIDLPWHPSKTDRFDIFHTLNY